MDFPCGAVDKNPSANAGDIGPWFREDPTHCRATKLAHHHYRACALEPISHNY